MSITKEEIPTKTEPHEVTDITELIRIVVEDSGQLLGWWVNLDSTQKQLDEKILYVSKGASWFLRVPDLSFVANYLEKERKKVGEIGKEDFKKHMLKQLETNMDKKEFNDYSEVMKKRGKKL